MAWVLGMVVESGLFLRPLSQICPITMTTPTDGNKPAVWPFWLLTSVVILSAAVWIVIRWPDIDTLGPSQVGDLAAGLFSPLAFLWLLYAALAQRSELQLQRQELRENNLTQQLQQQELHRQANALAAQTDHILAQIERDRRRASVSRKRMVSELESMMQETDTLAAVFRTAHGGMTGEQLSSVASRSQLSSAQVLLARQNDLVDLEPKIQQLLIDILATCQQYEVRQFGFSIGSTEDQRSFVRTTGSWMVTCLMNIQQLASNAANAIRLADEKSRDQSAAS